MTDPVADRRRCGRAAKRQQKDHRKQQPRVHHDGFTSMFPRNSFSPATRWEFLKRGRFSPYKSGCPENDFRKVLLQGQLGSCQVYARLALPQQNPETWRTPLASSPWSSHSQAAKRVILRLASHVQKTSSHALPHAKTGLNEACAKCLAGSWGGCYPCVKKSITKLPLACPLGDQVHTSTTTLDRPRSLMHHAIFMQPRQSSTPKSAPRLTSRARLG